MTTQSYVKVCSCKSTSSTHQFRVFQVPYEEHGIPNAFVSRHVFYPQPSCDECGTRWRETTEGTSS